MANIVEELTTYSVSINSTNATYTPTTTSITSEEILTYTFTADEGYEFPEEYSSYIYVEDTNGGYTITRNDSSSVTITLIGDELTDNPTVNVEAVETNYNISADLFNCTAASDNPTTIEKNGIISLTFIPNTGYYFKESSLESLVGASLDEVNIVNGNLKVNIVNPTADVTIGISAYIYSYSITYNLTGCTSKSTNPTTINYGDMISLTFTADEGYTLPNDIIVTNAITDYWSASTGQLDISQPSEGITITIKAFREGNSKPVYKYTNGAWAHQTAYQFLGREWVLISKTSVPIGLNIPVIVDGVEVKQVLVDGTEITNIIIE